MAGRPIQRSGDADSGGGVASSGHGNVLINGRPALKPGSSVTPHIGCSPKRKIHCIARTTPTSTTVFANGIPLVLTGGRDTCGHSRVGGSPNVNAV